MIQRVENGKQILVCRKCNSEWKKRDATEQKAPEITEILKKISDLEARNQKLSDENQHLKLLSMVERMIF